MCLFDKPSLFVMVVIVVVVVVVIVVVIVLDIVVIVVDQPVVSSQKVIVEIFRQFSSVECVFLTSKKSHFSLDNDVLPNWVVGFLLTKSHFSKKLEIVNVSSNF